MKESNDSIFSLKLVFFYLMMMAFWQIEEEEKNMSFSQYLFIEIANCSKLKYDDS